MTIDGIYYVVDPGFVKQKVYNSKSGIDALVVTPISQVNSVFVVFVVDVNQVGRSVRNLLLLEIVSIQKEILHLGIVCCLPA